MSVKDNFTADEWFKVMNGPGRAGAAVVAASPSGVTGLLAEAQAIGQAIREQVSAQGRTPLLEAMAADLVGTPPDPRDLPPQERPRNMDEARAQNVEGVRQAVWLVNSKASPEDAAAYRHLLWTVAERTAQAAREGGFLGLGGEQVSEQERAVLDELRRVIGPDAGTGAVPITHETPPVNPDGSGNSG
ncbi:hypothetical protein E5F05_16740 [Deinococcus metallilatus]|uniref:Uncharacterized protein n=1 Tax=Deinococcus metallilatus TaxID=1211322 RepID=A0AAE5YTU8_9DEIO|nr:hypothetical protein [Deinococcus metallilatus]MBB5294842.1 hypothetical protein [Deinococcus metallilatus]QBY09441.1 hypothetical protein E5F05_16740 [Deinococcus metallilatus]RXJ09446.1 hypothetical protein ERJ73_15580 [Deinococcus metallilatus]TLK28969.1 hypothetical protein FCS05_07345 [Deinococcus metallilatus]GMA16769.1 hypothetical protein GCM10025871_31000 [Deinococcus metallilatus]